MLLRHVLLFFSLDPGITRKVSGNSAAVSVLIWAASDIFQSSSLAGRKMFLHGCRWKFISNAHPPHSGRNRISSLVRVVISQVLRGS